EGAARYPGELARGRAGLDAEAYCGKRRASCRAGLCPGGTDNCSAVSAVDRTVRRFWSRRPSWLAAEAIDFVVEAPVSDYGCRELRRGVAQAPCGDGARRPAHQWFQDAPARRVGATPACTRNLAHPRLCSAAPDYGQVA